LDTCIAFPDINLHMTAFRTLQGVLLFINIVHSVAYEK